MIGESELLLDYLVTAQKVESTCTCTLYIDDFSLFFSKICSGVIESSTVQLEAFLVNGKSKEFSCSSHSRTSHALVVCVGIVLL